MDINQRRMRIFRKKILPQLSVCSSCHPHLCCASDQRHLGCLSDGLHELLVCNRHSYLSCSSWETPCLNVTHVLMFSDFWTDYLILKPHLTKSLPDHVFLSWNKTRGFTPICILHLGPTVIPGSKWREKKTNNKCTAVISLLLGIGVNFLCALQVLTTSEIPSLLSTDDVCLASSNHQLTPREQVCLWVGSGWDDECLLQAWGELRRRFLDGDATPACCGTERFQPERKALNLPVSYVNEPTVVNKWWKSQISGRR